MYYCRFELDEYERASCMRSVSLKSEGTLSGRKAYIALGTNYAYNEDVTCRGRVVIFDVIEVVPEPGLPLTKNKLKVLSCLDNWQTSSGFSLFHTRNIAID